MRQKHLRSHCQVPTTSMRRPHGKSTAALSRLMRDARSPCKVTSDACTTSSTVMQRIVLLAVFFLLLGIGCRGWGLGLGVRRGPTAKHVLFQAACASKVGILNAASECSTTNGTEDEVNRQPCSELARRRPAWDTSDTLIPRKRTPGATTMSTNMANMGRLSWLRGVRFWTCHILCNMDRSPISFARLRAQGTVPVPRLTWLLETGGGVGTCKPLCLIIALARKQESAAGTSMVFAQDDINKLK